MSKQPIFILTLILTLGVFAYTLNRLISFFRLTQANFPIRDFGKRFGLMMEVAFGQTKILRKPLIGIAHAMVFWGFCIITAGSIEMVLDGLTGSERVLKALGPVYDVITASGDIFALIVTLAILAFLVRRIFMHIKRFQGIEMASISHKIDANSALTLILILMLSLQGMNIAYLGMKIGDPAGIEGLYPVSAWFLHLFENGSREGYSMFYTAFWWTHILIIFLFINILPYSKHFHVFMSVPNVFLSRLEPLGKLPTMESVTREVRLMMDPQNTFNTPAAGQPVQRFGVRDIEDISWKNYFDSLACTECGRCTDVCPANLTGKKLSPRKIIMDVRSRMNKKGPGLVKNGKDYTDNKSLIRDYISEEELWACTLCNACAQECPININHPTLIVDMRRYLVMEEASSPGLLNVMFNNIENNGAPWQFSPEDRLLWAKDLKINVK